ncbi:N-acetylglucosamine-6-sulfatase [Elysia marginata]|uniref:N-acetylglucosamine-6-sulfatase n=1 Tax=Elysia marginata TaxID=1093978 RepID=A0AAV4HRU7_9GAST|nr:N-acetylglucosamine-6-sulfatase [Elysia marginata]
MTYEKRKRESQTPLGSMSFSGIWSSISETVFRFSQEDLSLGALKDSIDETPFREYVLIEYFGEAEGVVPECPSLDHRDVSESVTNVDLAPTFVDLSGSNGQPHQFDGMSFARILHSETHQFRSTVLVEYYGEEAPKVPECPQFNGQHLDVSTKL